MLKTVTLSAEEELIQQAILTAQRQQTTLEAEFQKWLNHYISQEQRLENYTQLMTELSHVQVGHVFTREELNER